MTVFPLVISWFLTFGYVPKMADFVESKTAKIDSGRIATVAQIGLSASTDDELFTIYTDMQNFQYARMARAGNSNRSALTILSGFRSNQTTISASTLNTNVITQYRIKQ